MPGVFFRAYLKPDFGRVGIEIKRTSLPNTRHFRSIRDFIQEQRARLGIIVSTDAAARVYEERLIGLSFNRL